MVHKHYMKIQWLCALVPDPLAIYSIKRIALASSQGLALLGFFPHAISFSQSLINNADIFSPLALILKLSLILSNTNTKL